MTSGSFQKAIGKIDEVNSKDPNQETLEGHSWPKELLHSRLLTEWIERLVEHPPEILLLAIRGQHISRWSIPRSSFPMTRPGYHQWKNRLKQFHAETTSTILLECGYAPEIASRVERLILKKDFPQDPFSQAIEDALCLLFLERQLQPLAEKTEAEKVVNALKKSWAKMSGRAREEALDRKSVV